MTTRISEEVSRNLTLRRIYASDNYSFFVKKIWCLFLSILSTLFQNYSLGENTAQRLSGIIKNEQRTDERRSIKVHHLLYVTPKEVEGLCHFTLPLILGLNGGGMTLHSLLMNLSHNYE